MYRHQVRLVLRFGAQTEFREIANRLVEAESARGWTPPRVWYAVQGRVNEVVIEHDYRSTESFRNERNEFHADPGEVGALLTQLAEATVPGTASQFEFDGLDP
jgi:hypothetical protein